MATLELERIKAAIAISDVDEAKELATALEARFASLGIAVELRATGRDEEIAPELRSEVTWGEIESDLARHHAGERGFDREHMRRSLRSPLPEIDL